MKKIFFFFALMIAPLAALAQMPDWKEGYEGETDSKGKPEGKGTMVWWETNHKYLRRYEGYWVKGIPGDGIHPGTLTTYESGKFYGKTTSVFLPAKKNKEKIFDFTGWSGETDITFSDGSRFVGSVTNDKNGTVRTGVTCWKSGSYHKGSWRNGKLNGEGKLYQKGQVNCGDFKDGSLPFGFIIFMVEKRQAGISYGTWGTQLGLRQGVTINTYNEFLPIHTYANLKEDNDKLFCDLKEAKAHVFLIHDKTKMGNCEKAMWSGDIVDGYANGEGTGLANVNGHWVYFRGQYNKGVPRSDITVKELDGKKLMMTVAKVLPTKNNTRFVQFGDNYGILADNGDYLVAPRYSAIKETYADGTTLVQDTEKGEIVIDSKGNFVRFTDNQIALNKEQERKDAIAKAEHEEAARQEKLRQQELAKKKAAEDAKWEEKKKNCEGMTIEWYETASYDIGKGGLGDAIIGAIGLGGLNKVSYRVHYKAIVEKVIAQTSVKCIIKSVDIDDPRLASANYLKYRKYAVSDLQENLGKTRVLEFKEFNLVRK